MGKKKGVEELKKTRELIGSLNFNMQYQQKVPQGKGGIFKSEWIKYFSDYQKLDGNIYVKRKDEENGEIIREMVRVYQGVDLAISQKTTADSFVIATIGVGVDSGFTYLLDLFRGKLGFSEQISKIKEYAAKWDMVETIGIESVAYQQALPDELIKTTNLPIRKMNTIKDKVTRLSKFSGQWENDKVFMYSHIKGLDILEDELLAFPEGEHDDTIDAFCLAWETAFDNKPKPKPARAGGNISNLGF